MPRGQKKALGDALASENLVRNSNALNTDERKRVDARYAADKARYDKMPEDRPSKARRKSKARPKSRGR